jgi:hypothetical protein
LAYGFLACVLSGPRFSPLGQFVTRVVTPRLHLHHRIVPGPPKRFAQGVGVVFSGGALLSWGLGAHGLSYALIAGLVVAASLEAFAGFCLGCVVFNRLMRWGVIPADVCEECYDISGRLAAASPEVGQQRASRSSTTPAHTPAHPVSGQRQVRHGCADRVRTASGPAGSTNAAATAGRAQQNTAATRPRPPRTTAWANWRRPQVPGRPGVARAAARAACAPVPRCRRRPQRAVGRVAAAPRQRLHPLIRTGASAPGCRAANGAAERP